MVVLRATPASHALALDVAIFSPRQRSDRGRRDVPAGRQAWRRGAQRRPCSRLKQTLQHAKILVHRLSIAFERRIVQLVQTTQRQCNLAPIIVGDDAKRNVDFFSLGNETQ
jgi:hypothetical protein